MNVVVVGAGFGGLIAAALLQRRGARVHLLEAHEHVGGCASAFELEGFRFQTGATTLIGLEPGMPLRTVLDELGISFEVPRLTTNIAVHGQPFGRFVLGCEDEVNDDAVTAALGLPAATAFKAARELGRKAWQLVQRPRMPPRSWSDVFAAAITPSTWALVPDVLRSTRSTVVSLGAAAALPTIDELLLVSTQGDAAMVPWLFGALGLEYLQRPCYLPRGGVSALPETVASTFTARGGTLSMRTKAIEVSSRGDGFEVRTDTDQRLCADAVVLNLTHWDAARILHPALRQVPATQARRHARAWGAMVLYAGIDDSPELDGPPYHQLVLPEPLRCHARSLFVSFSERADTRCAPEGSRALTVSCHVDADAIAALDDSGHRAFKAQFRDEALAALRAHWPKTFAASPRVCLAGTPRTFASFTQRHRGYVGGLPLTFGTLLRGYPNGRTAHPRLVRVGDTVSPGQSLLATAWGARAVVTALQNV